MHARPHVSVFSQQQLRVLLQMEACAGSLDSHHIGLDGLLGLYGIDDAQGDGCGLSSGRAGSQGIQGTAFAGGRW